MKGLSIEPTDTTANAVKKIRQQCLVKFGEKVSQPATEQEVTSKQEPFCKSKAIEADAFVQALSQS